MSTSEDSPRAYATVEDFELRLGKPLTGQDRKRAKALLQDASVLIRAVARLDWNGDPPEVVRTIALNVALRAFRNPEGVRQQTLGDLSMTFGTVDTGVMLTPEEERLIRLAAGWGQAIDSIQLTTGYNGTTTVYVPVEGGGDPLPWLAE